MSLRMRSEAGKNLIMAINIEDHNFFAEYYSIFTKDLLKSYGYAPNEENIKCFFNYITRFSLDRKKYEIFF